MPLSRLFPFLYFALSGLAIAQLGLAFDRPTAMIFLLVAGFCLSLAVAEIERSVRGQRAFRFRTDVQLSEAMQKAVRAISCVVPIGALLIGILSATFNSLHGQSTLGTASVPAIKPSASPAPKSEPSATKFDPSAVSTVGIDKGTWVAIPEWFAGTWKHTDRTVHREPCTLANSAGELDDSAKDEKDCLKFSSEGTVTHGLQQGACGFIWDCLYAGQCEKLSGSGTAVYSYPISFSVKHAEGNPDAISITTVAFNFTVDDQSTLIMKYWSKEKTEYTPTKNGMRALISMETYNEPSFTVDTINDINKLSSDERKLFVKKSLEGKKADYRAVLTQDSYKVSDFVPVDHINGSDIKQLFQESTDRELLN